MASKSQSPYGDDALNATSDGLSHPRPPRRERTGKRSAPADNRELSAMLDNPPAPTRAPFDPSSSREALIATAAYYRAQRRGFLPGYELEDWLAAEREVDEVGADSI